MDTETWDTIGELVAWLDDHSQLDPSTERLMRLMKLSEEVGEVAQAVSGAMGTNPRKGQTNDWDHVENELCDVILTAMVALQTVNPNAGKVFATRLGYVADRSLNRPPNT
ncbi:NTP pyrophosphatase (non-canonical NTP hydrolase) [Streptacidiphilus sp. BW17]|uniref:MazG-like family protein n=1 Tax=Streptacidiphilus sp. BW17 TaxID=3156274 RepID=UPI003519755A